MDRIGVAVYANKLLSLLVDALKRNLAPGHTPNRPSVSHEYLCSVAELVS
jgi:hypothetical protein